MILKLECGIDIQCELLDVRTDRIIVVSTEQRKRMEIILNPKERTNLLLRLKVS